MKKLFNILGFLLVVVVHHVPSNFSSSRIKRPVSKFCSFVDKFVQIFFFLFFWKFEIVEQRVEGFIISSGHCDENFVEGR